MVKVIKKMGKIIIPKNTLVQRHELQVAQILVKTGDDVIFLQPNWMPTPDILFQGVTWEIKSPLGSSRRTIENNLRLALRQSDNVILDLRRIKVPERKCMAEIYNRASKLVILRRLLVIDKSRQIIVVKQK